MPPLKPTDDRPPEQPPEEEGPFRLLDLRFWLALVFIVLCMIAAGVVGLYGPKIWPKAPPHSAPAASSAHAGSR